MIRTRYILAAALFAAVATCALADPAALRAAEAQRVATLNQASRTVVCIYPDRTLVSGGSGVIIDPRGYGLTNFHVIAELLATNRQGFGGMADGNLYPLTVVGIDPGGDVALFKLSGEPNFPTMPLGDSDQLALGQPVAALGNPFLTAEDFQPTVTFGHISGLNRYQGDGGNALEYADCIQVTTSINPGNSGGPLIDIAGRLIGINGRASFKTEDMLGRGRVNVGLGYAITINQIKRFLPCLAAGQMCAHGTLGATVRTAGDHLIFDRLQPDGPADTAGVERGDVLLALDGAPVPTPNAYNNIIVSRPADALVTLTVRRDDQTLDLAARLAPLRLDRAPVWVPDPRYADNPIELQTTTAAPPDSTLPVAPLDRALAVVVKLYGGKAGLAAGYGSGVLISADGNILTVLSAMLDTPNLRAVLPDGRRFDARVIRRDARRQLALLDIEAADLDHARPATSDHLAAGDWVLAAANPFKVADGAEPVTLTPGTLSGRTTLDARRRAHDFPYRGQVLLTDMVVATPGSPGGGLFDARGELIGLLGKPVRSTRTNTWLNYALPAEQLIAFLDQTDSAAAPLAADLSPLDLGLHLFDIGGRNQPAYVERVVPDSPAWQAGVHPGDLIFALAGRDVATCDEFTSRLADMPPNQPVIILVKRGDELTSREITPPPETP